MSDNIADVIIIGAGAAGLAAASELDAHGKNIILLEGRNRIGGRIDTLHDPAWPLPIERGAEFIHGRPQETADILHAASAIAYDIADTHHLFLKGRLEKPPDLFEQIEKVLAATDKVRPSADISFEECLRKYASRISPQKKAWARSYVEGFDAADAREVSARWLAQSRKASEKIQGDRLARIHDGYGRLLDFLHTGISEARHQIELSATVTRIHWDNRNVSEGSGLVEVHATRPASPPLLFSAKHALVTVPVSILGLPPGEVGHIAFDPSLPVRKLQAIAQTRTGPVVKVILRFKDPLWEKIEPDLNFFHAPGGPTPLPFPTWWTTLPLRTTLLTAWAGGPAATALAGKTTDQILTLAISALAHLLRIPRRRIQSQVIAAHVCDWQAELLSRGAYSYAAVGGAAAAAELARPLPPRLFFAGEATHTGLTGTVPAALASAHRAVKEILQHK